LSKAAHRFEMMIIGVREFRLAGKERVSEAICERIRDEHERFLDCMTTHLASKSFPEYGGVCGILIDDHSPKRYDVLVNEVWKYERLVPRYINVNVRSYDHRRGTVVGQVKIASTADDETRVSHETIIELTCRPSELSLEKILREGIPVAYGHGGGLFYSPYVPIVPILRRVMPGVLVTAGDVVTDPSSLRAFPGSVSIPIKYADARS